MTREYIDEDKVNGVIDDMFSLLLKSANETITKDFAPLSHDDLYHQHLVLSASLYQNDPPTALFVASKKWISAVV